MNKKEMREKAELIIRSMTLRVFVACLVAAFILGVVVRSL